MFIFTFAIQRGVYLSQVSFLGKYTLKQITECRKCIDILEVNIVEGVRRREYTSVSFMESNGTGMSLQNFL